MSKHGFYQRWGKRCVALLVCLSLLVQPFAAYADEIVAYSHDNEAVVREDLPQDTEEARAYVEDHCAPHVYEDGVIKIYNAAQLEKIGSGQPVTDTDDDADAFGEGTAVSENGNVVEYAMDGRYQLMNDIALDADALWQLPVGFTGTFVNEPCGDDATLYDPDKDTIYVYHSYQLQTIASKDGAKAPVMSKDALADQYGIGKLVYPDGSLGKVPPEEAQDYLTYSKEHRYVLSKQFTEATPTLQSAQYFAANQPKAKAGAKANAKAALTPEEIQLGGRAHVGQVYTTIDNEKYILIGNEQQLQAVGSGKHVTPMLFLKVSVERLLGRDEYFMLPYYPGDADLDLESFKSANISHKASEFERDTFIRFDKDPTKANELMNEDLSKDGLLGKLTAGLGGLLGGLIAGILGAPKYALVGLKNENTAQASIGVSEYTTHDELKQTYNNIKYDTDQNYIVFRNIDCTSIKNWQPIHLSGSMEGRLNMVEGAVPTIRNVTVNKNGELDVEHDYGIGFFGSLRSGMDEKTFLPKKTVVKNLSIDEISVTNSSNKIAPHADSLIDGLLQILGGLVGGGLDLLTPILGVKLGDVITGLLTLRQNSEDIFATGSFVGAIKGNVYIENCTVINAQVSSVKGMCGGFVGYSEGVEEYDGLSQLLGGTVKLLSALLNIIPGVGLGDLITVLLENDVALSELIPTGYNRPMLSACSVTIKEGAVIGSATENYNGGFIGAQVSTITDQCTVSNLGKVQAQNGAGGFAGIVRDDMIAGVLNDLGANLAVLDIQSKQTNCTVEGKKLHVEAASDANGKNGDYAGGFNGVMTYGKCENCTVQDLSEVSAANYAGGFAGRATIGYGSTVGQSSIKKGTLLSAVGGLLTDVVAGSGEKMNQLLSITGNLPSELKHCTVLGDAVSVTASKDYAGGLIGAGDGVQVDQPKKEEGQETPPVTSAANASRVSALQLVQADNYAGGIAGMVSTANPIGVLNNALGVGHYLGPFLQYTTVSGKDWTVQATHKNAAGGIGLMVGGTLKDVNIEGLSEVNAGNYAAGVLGRAGTGALATQKGLDLLGLGLIKVNNVLSLAKGVAVTVENIHLQGPSAGLTIHANGNADITDSESICAGGFAAEAEGIDATDCVVSELKEVTASAPNSTKKSYAGGFIGRSHTGGLAGLAEEKNDGALTLPGILEVKSLLDLVPYLLPTYTACKVHFVSNGTQKAAPEASAGDATNGEASSQNKGETSGDAKPLFEVLNANADVSAQKETAKAPEKDEAAIQEDSAVRKDNASTEKAVAQAANPQVKADIAGGFVGWMQSGEINGKKSSTPPSTEAPAPTPNEQQPQNGPATKAALKADASSVTSPSTEQASGEKPADTKPSGEKAPDKDATAPKAVEKTYCVEGLEAVEGCDYAGGFAGQIEAGAVAASNGLKLLNGVLNLDLSQLLNVLNVYIPTVNDAGVHGVEGKGEGALVGYTVKATAKDSVAGGYAGAMSGARVNRSDVKSLRSTKVTPPKDGLESQNGESYFDDAQSTYAVTAGKYAGGYVGSADIDSAAGVGGGLDLLGGALKLSNILSAVDAVATKISDSDVYGAPGGFSVRANGTDQKDIVRGMAGGFVGRSSGSQMTNSNVNNFNYIIGQENAGGYAGMMEPGNVASVIEDTGVLGGLLNVQEAVASLVNSFIPIVKDSSTTCVPCGGGVRAQGATDAELSRGMAGGYVGYNHGGRILGENKECAAVRIRSVYGHEFAGGFTGLMETADMASTGNLSLLYGLLDLSNILGLLGAVYPTETNTAVYGPLRDIDMDTWNGWVTHIGQNGNYGNQLPQTPVTTQKELDALIKKYAYGYNVVAGRDQVGTRAHEGGCAGGYVGRMKSGVVTEAHAWDPKSVVAYKGAGGFAGEMLTGGVASVGSLNLLDLPIVGSLDAVQTFVPVVRNSDVTGFQSGLRVHATGVPQSQGSAKVEKVGDAGGFVGRMVGGQIWGEWNNPAPPKPADEKIDTNVEKNEQQRGESTTQKTETAPSSEQNKVPEKATTETRADAKAAAASEGTEDAHGDVANTSAQSADKTEAPSETAAKSDADAAQTPAPAYATGAVPDAANDRCFVDNLRRVDGTRSVGGFAGVIEPGSAAAVDTASSEGLLGGLLQHVIGTPGDLLKVLNATVATVTASDVNAWHGYGIVVNGLYNDPTKADTQYAKAVGGFVGESDGAVFGKLKDDSQAPKYGTSVQCLRSVTGGEHVGGYFGLADVSSVAQVSDGKTGILGQLVTLGSTDILDGFRTYVYDGSVTGADKAGLEVNAKEGKKSEYVNDPVYTGNAGGFGGSLLNGSVKRSDVTGLRQVNGLNYTGGFVGHLGKSGTVDLDNLGIFSNLVELGTGVLDIFGSHVEDSTVTGMNGGFTVASRNGAKEKEEISGGFVGMADLAKLKNDKVNDLKQVASGTTAGGFAGKTDFEYLIKLEGNSGLINKLVDLLNTLLQELWVRDLQEGNLIHIDLGIIEVDALYKGDLVHVNLLGLDIAVALAKDKQLATIYIGDSKITVNGIQNDGSLAPGSAQKFKNEIQLSLIKANRTRIDHCQVTGVPIGYDVYGAGADNYNNGTNTKGHAGGFVGWNNEGLLKGNDMFYADVVRGVEKTTAPFSGFSILESNWNFNKLFGIEGDHNNYRIYREFGQAFDDIVKAPGGTPLQDAFQSTGTWDNIFKIVHMTENKVEKFSDLKGAQATSETKTIPLDAYMENGAMALLMTNTPTEPTPIPEDELLPPDMQDPCSDLVNLTVEKRWKGDNPDKRPESITLTITRTYEENGKVVQDPSFNETVTMSKADYQSEDVWQKVLSSPNYTAYRVGTDGTTKYYYTYHVSEAALEGYSTTIKYNDTYHYSTTITNDYKFLGGLLPETGGSGIGWLMLAGLLLVAAGYIAKRRRQHHEGRDAS